MHLRRKEKKCSLCYQVVISSRDVHVTVNSTTCDSSSVRVNCCASHVSAHPATLRSALIAALKESCAQPTQLSNVLITNMGIQNRSVLTMIALNKPI